MLERGSSDVGAKVYPLEREVDRVRANVVAGGVNGFGLAGSWADIERGLNAAESGVSKPGKRVAVFFILAMTPAYEPFS